MEKRKQESVMRKEAMGKRAMRNAARVQRYKRAEVTEVVIIGAKGKESDGMLIKQNELKW